MSDLTRLWIVLAAPPVEAVDGGVELAPIAAVVRQPSAPAELVARCCALWRIESAEALVSQSESDGDARRGSMQMGETGPPPEPRTKFGNEPGRRALLWALDALASRHAGDQICLVATSELAQLAFARALRQSDETRRFPTGVWNVVVDWPAHRAERLSAGLIGLDLDWVPPPPPKLLGRFPGGPGSAATRQT